MNNKIDVKKKRETMPSTLQEWKPALLLFGFILFVVVAFAVAAAVIDISTYGL